MLTFGVGLFQSDWVNTRIRAVRVRPSTETALDHHVGIDVSLELSSVCVLDATGKGIREAKVASEPEALVGFLRGLELAIVRVGMEAGPLSRWLYDGHRQVVRRRPRRGLRDGVGALTAMRERQRR